MIKEYLLKKLKSKITRDLQFQADYFKGVNCKVGKEITNAKTLDNLRCHHNSYDNYRSNPDTLKIRASWCYENENDGFVHFINYDVENKVYVDDTLGGLRIHYNYLIFNCYWLENQLKEEPINPSQWLMWVREDLYNRYCTNWLWKMFINVDDL